MPLRTPEHLHDAIAALRYAYPLLVFAYFLTTLTVTVCTLQTRRLRIKDEHVRRNVILAVLGAATGGYLAEAITVGVYASEMHWSPGQDRVIFLMASLITFAAQVLALTDSKFPVWYPYFGTWILGVFTEVVLLLVSNIYNPPISKFDFICLFEQVWRICSFLILLALYFGLRNDPKRYDNADAERQSLLRKKLSPKPLSSEDSESTSNGYGGTTTANQESDAADENDDAESEDSYLASQKKSAELVEKRLNQDGNWFTYAKGFTVFLPHIWPYRSKTLQFRAFLVVSCLLVKNALNVLVPNQMGVMVDSLTRYVQDGDKSQNVWLPVLVYTLLLFASGGACLGWLKSWLWLPLETYSYDALSTAAHAHIMNLSSDFHDSKTSSDLTQAVSGGRSVSGIVETVCLDVVPRFIDLALAFAYLWSHYGPYMGLLMGATTASYIYVTTKLVAVRANLRREYIALWRKEWTVGQQSLDSWNTASLFNMIPYEETRYGTAVRDFRKAYTAFFMSSRAIDAAQGLVMMLGLLGALWLGVWQVTRENRSIGSFTTLLVYWAQLQSPLAFFSSMFRNLTNNFMDAERLLELFQTKPSIVDLPNAKPLKLGKGLIEFDRVSFSYDDRKPTLKDVSFTVPAGKTVALVGETGGGKSTMLKLISRFYDCKSGSILIDGQNIRNVKLNSLREKVGVVPQHPTLFNDSIINNLRYARQNASDEEVHDACKAAAIHKKIMSFPDGYKSKVGDCGQKLSGGEKQRIAIARAILKQPEIILLDEATSAVDTETEQLIQEGLRSLCKGRTTFIVAHRLSTIMNADKILVVMDGEIVESGSHQELIHAKGKYNDLWSKQIFVKPTDHSRSRSPKKRDADIINDLTSGQQKVELANVKKMSPHEEPEQPSGGQESASSRNAEAEKSEAKNGHKREGSKLKPDAPEFVPAHFVKNPTENITKSVSKEATRLQKKSEREDHRATSTLGRRTDRKPAKRDGAPNASTPEDFQSAGPSADQLAEGETSGTDRSRTKRGRGSRRHGAKSEPTGRIPDSNDGAQECEFTAVSLGEGQPMSQNTVQQPRRVSAPSDPPVRSHDSRGGRIKRPRHWRLRNRAADNPDSLSGSIVTTSGEGSTDSHVVAAPVPSPAEGPAPSTTTIRFAPGC